MSSAFSIDRYVLLNNFPQNNCCQHKCVGAQGLIIFILPQIAVIYFIYIGTNESNLTFMTYFILRQKIHNFHFCHSGAYIYCI
jgi:hypothetical protein